MSLFLKALRNESVCRLLLMARIPFGEFLTSAAAFQIEWQPLLTRFAFILRIHYKDRVNCWLFSQRLLEMVAVIMVQTKEKRTIRACNYLLLMFQLDDLNVDLSEVAEQLVNATAVKSLAQPPLQTGDLIAVVDVIEKISQKNLGGLHDQIPSVGEQKIQQFVQVCFLFTILTKIPYFFYLLSVL